MISQYFAKPMQLLTNLFNTFLLDLKWFGNQMHWMFKLYIHISWSPQTYIEMQKNYQVSVMA